MCYDNVYAIDAEVPVESFSKSHKAEAISEAKIA